MDFDSLKAEYLTCRRCPELCGSRTQVVFGSGNPQADVLLIGEAPGAHEDTQGIPFCGMSGKILNELLVSAGLLKEQIFITNTILCRPPGNRNPTKQEVENCSERLNQLIALMEPKVIVTIGNFATDRIIGKTSIKSIHGKMFSAIINGRKITVIPVIHPASYLYSGRNPELLEEMKEDFRTIAGVVGKQRAQTSLGEF